MEEEKEEVSGLYICLGYIYIPLDTSGFSLSAYQREKKDESICRTLPQVVALMSLSLQFLSPDEQPTQGRALSLQEQVFTQFQRQA